MKRVLTALVTLALVVSAWAGDLDVRHYYLTNDVLSALPAANSLKWYQGESIVVDLTVMRGTARVDLSGTGIVTRFETVGWTNPATLFTCYTGTVVNGSNGTLNFSLTPAQVNLPTGQYTSYVRLYQSTGSVTRYVGTAYKATAMVLYAPSATNTVYVGPMTNTTYEIDPIFSGSIAAQITGTDTARWNVASGATGNVNTAYVLGTVGATAAVLQANIDWKSTGTVQSAFVYGVVSATDAVARAWASGQFQTGGTYQVSGNYQTQGQYQAAGNYATGTPVYAESDPIWGAVSNTVRDGAALGATSTQPADLAAHTNVPAIAAHPGLGSASTNVNGAFATAAQGALAATAMQTNPSAITDGAAGGTAWVAASNTVRQGAALGATALQAESDTLQAVTARGASSTTTVNFGYSGPPHAQVEIQPVQGQATGLEILGGSLYAIATSSSSSSQIHRINLSGTYITNGSFFGNGGGLTNLVEADPIWAGASNTVRVGAALGATAIQAESDPTALLANGTRALAGNMSLAANQLTASEGINNMYILLSQGRLGGLADWYVWGRDISASNIRSTNGYFYGNGSQLSGLPNTNASQVMAVQLATGMVSIVTQTNAVLAQTFAADTTFSGNRNAAGYALTNLSSIVFTNSFLSISGGTFGTTNGMCLNFADAPGTNYWITHP